MPYHELEQFLDIKQAKLTEHITTWNLLGLIAGVILGFALVRTTGLVLLFPLPVILGVGVTIRRRNMLMAERAWIYGLFWVQRWLGRDEIAYVPPRRTAARERRVVVVHRVVNGQTVFGMHKEEE